jgi:alanine racemase
MKTIKTKQTGYPVWIEIDRKKLRENLAAIRSVAPNNPIMAMIKCNAYGMGIEVVAKTLISDGVNIFGVCDSRDALVLRKMSKEITIVNFSPRTSAELEKFKGKNITPVIMSAEEDLTSLEKSVYIKVNTGLNRWGLSVEETLEVAKKLKGSGVKIEALCTTLLETDADKAQISKLKKLTRTLKKNDIAPKYISYASSQSLTSAPINDGSILRIGILLYGLYPDKESEIEQKISVSHIFSLKSRICQIRLLQKGDSILYKNKFTAFKKMRIALLPVGYAHGYPVQLAGKADVLVHGIRCRVLGITMSTIIIDITSIKDAAIYDEVVLIGSQDGSSITPAEVSDIANISCYVLINSFSPSIKHKTVS